MEKAQVAFATNYFSTVSKLDVNIQAKVNKVIEKFQNNPKSPGLNYETLNATKDNSLRSIRVDQAYRIILCAPDVGDVYIFLIVEHHDKAYQWAANYKCQVNANTGLLQIIPTDYVKQAASLPKFEKISNQPNVFSDLKDRQLLKLGVPEELLGKVREVTSENQLNMLERILPGDAHEDLSFYLMEPSDITYEYILSERDVDDFNNYDTSNFAKALDRLNSRSQFVVTRNEDELASVLQAGLEKWRVFLHPSQRKLAEGHKNGPLRVLGGAGTGKTVVAMHRAKWLAANVATEENKVLFTTFTKNLAVDIENNLKSICTQEEFVRIEVVNLDLWVQHFLKEYVGGFRLMLDESILSTYWKNAVYLKPVGNDLPDSFFKEEWQRIIQPQGVNSLEAYKKVSRIGRGTRLDRQQRVDIWPVFESYRKQLDVNSQKEMDDCYRAARECIASSKLGLPYCSIVVDEAQDMGTQAFLLLREMVTEEKNDMFIVGDAHQRIYGRNRVVLGQCNINIRGRAKKLHINYRTTDEIRRWASGLLEGRNIDDLDGGKDTNALYKSLTHGVPPVLEHFTSDNEQAEYIKALVDKSDWPLSHTCVVARTTAELMVVREKLEALGLATAVIEPSKVDSKNDNAIKMATIHRVKGLEFDQLILASANEGLVPLAVAMKGKADKVSAQEAETEERSLVYVAITRARKQAYVLSYGVMSSFFR